MGYRVIYPPKITFAVSHHTSSSYFNATDRLKSIDNGFLGLTTGYLHWSYSYRAGSAENVILWDAVKGSLEQRYLVYVAIGGKTTPGKTAEVLRPVQTCLFDLPVNKRAINCKLMGQVKWLFFLFFISTSSLIGG